MITILEGPDMAGKTTLAASFGCRVIHNGPQADMIDRFKLDLADYYEDQLLSIDPREDVVFDRLHIGELIYGPIFRGRSRLTFSAAQVITELAEQLGARLIHVDTSDRTLLERYRAAEPGREDLVTKEDTLMRIAAQYRLLCSSWERWVTT